MRIDKFLKISRIIKRRSVAKELADNDRIYINNKLAKASSLIKVSDRVNIIFGNHNFSFIIKELREHCKKEEAFNLYEIINEENYEEKKAE